MTSDVVTEPRAGYLLAVVTGPRTRQSVVHAAERILEECARQGATRLMVNVRAMTGGLTPTDAFEVAAHQFPELLRNRAGLRVAILDLAENRERFEFFDTVASNRGLNLRFFDEIEKAERWLED